MARKGTGEAEDVDSKDSTARDCQCFERDDYSSWRVPASGDVVTAQPPYPTSRPRHALRWLLRWVDAGLLSRLARHIATGTAQRSFSDPATEWKDNIWPIRPQTHWDISTNFPFPRLLECDVEEGTWLRLDVHPNTGDFVSDMIGDLDCLSSEDAYDQSVGTATTRPILCGVPYDYDLKVTR
ncbi:hypothetical protein EDD18DRAFT_1334453 [Armillaria luteobubalina]|uniref:Uncharacterized protein n=1 Tax=Armillaria luteobubalina TaxID=153913 RepID=A0AA39PX21_9AGAR|nr:hypothetical protein EDD18DRAFT_1334453 [Armillaria luteobubalina]